MDRRHALRTENTLSNFTVASMTHRFQEHENTQAKAVYRARQKK